MKMYVKLIFNSFCNLKKGLYDVQFTNDGKLISISGGCHSSAGNKLVNLEIIFSYTVKNLDQGIFGRCGNCNYDMVKHCCNVWF